MECGQARSQRGELVDQRSGHGLDSQADQPPAKTVTNPCRAAGVSNGAVLPAPTATEVNTEPVPQIARARSGARETESAHLSTLALSRLWTFPHALRSSSRGQPDEHRIEGYAAPPPPLLRPRTGRTRRDRSRITPVMVGAFVRSIAGGATQLERAARGSVVPALQPPNRPLHQYA